LMWSRMLARACSQIRLILRFLFLDSAKTFGEIVFSNCFLGLFSLGFDSSGFVHFYLSDFGRRIYFRSCYSSSLFRVSRRCWAIADRVRSL